MAPCEGIEPTDLSQPAVFKTVCRANRHTRHMAVMPRFELGQRIHAYSRFSKPLPYQLGLHDHMVLMFLLNNNLNIWTITLTINYWCLLQADRPRLHPSSLKTTSSTMALCAGLEPARPCSHAAFREQCITNYANTAYGVGIRTWTETSNIIQLLSPFQLGLYRHIDPPSVTIW